MSGSESMMPRRPVGEILVSEGYLTPERLAEAMAVQHRPGERRLLGQILVSRGYITPAQIKIALARQKLAPRPSAGA